MKVGLIVVATNKYIQFAQPLYDSMQKYFLNEPDVERNMFLFTDKPAFQGPIVIYQKHEPWPAMTLKRYEIILKSTYYFQNMDYLYYCDADMLFVNKVGKEILGDIVATIHPGYWYVTRENFTYEKNPISTAFIGPDEGTTYYAGGFNGGKRECFLKMAGVIAANVNQDLARGHIATWHDESHLNRYLIDHPPTVCLSPSYIFPEAEWARNFPFSKILIALDKDHEAMRA
jgi:histo-blood group ABO system transferase